MADRRFPPPSTAKDNGACFIVKDRGGFRRLRMSVTWGNGYFLPLRMSRCSLKRQRFATGEVFFRHPMYPRRQPSNGLCGLSVVVRCAVLRRHAPRRGEDRFRNPFIQITRKGRKQGRDRSLKNWATEARRACAHCGQYRQAAGVAMLQVMIARFSEQPLSKRELDLRKELLIAGHRGILKRAKRRSGFSRLVAARFVTARPAGTKAISYVITDRGRARKSVLILKSDPGLPLAGARAPRTRRFAWGHHMKSRASHLANGPKEIIALLQSIRVTRQ